MRPGDYMCVSISHSNPFPLMTVNDWIISCLKNGPGVCQFPSKVTFLFQAPAHLSSKMKKTY